MQPLIIDISAHPQMPEVRRQILVPEFTVKFSADPDHQKISLPLVQELFTRTKTEQPAVDDQGTPTGETQVIYGEWEPFRGLGYSNQIACPTESNNRKWVNPQTLERVAEGTEGAVPELAAIWSQVGAAITAMLTGAVLSMDARGVFNDVTRL